MAGRRRLVNEPQLIELHAQGFNDREVGEKLGISPQAVWRRRNRLGLKPIRKHSKRLFTDQQLIELHEQGFNDREIGEKLGVSFGIVGFHRKSLGLKPIRKHRTTKDYKRKRLFTDQQLIELHAQGFNDVEIAEKLGVAKITVHRHRRRLGLKPVSRARNL